MTPDQLTRFGSLLETIHTGMVAMQGTIVVVASRLDAVESRLGMMESRLDKLEARVSSIGVSLADVHTQLRVNAEGHMGLVERMSPFESRLETIEIRIAVIERGLVESAKPRAAPKRTKAAKRR